MKIGEMSLKELMAAIYMRPGMYLPLLGQQKSITVLDAYLRGFCDGRARGDSSASLCELSEFQSWYQLTYGPAVTPLSVHHLLLEKNGGDESLAFDEYFSLWREYLNGKGGSLEAESGLGAVPARD